MGKVRTLLACRDCGQQLARWAGRCPGCGGWGTIEERAATELAAGGVEVTVLVHDGDEDQRVRTGFAGVDRVLGGGLVPGSVMLLAGEPGISKYAIPAIRRRSDMWPRWRSDS